jgi:hypothetical protein
LSVYPQATATYILPDLDQGDGTFFAACQRPFTSPSDQAFAVVEVLSTGSDVPGNVILFHGHGEETFAAPSSVLVPRQHSALPHSTTGSDVSVDLDVVASPSRELASPVGGGHADQARAARRIVGPEGTRRRQASMMQVGERLKKEVVVSQALRS